jgi:urease accessory protein
MTRTRVGRSALLGSLLWACATLAFAHAEGGGAAGPAGAFWEGVAHPAKGADHLLAMFTVGVLSMLMRGAHVWRVPMTFVGTMALGGLLGLLMGPLVWLEPAVSASAVVLGLLVASRPLPTAWRVYPVVVVFALLHGQAHGAEMPATPHAAPYFVGFLVGTALIHLLGVFVGDLVLVGGSKPWRTRVLGGGIALGGLALLWPFVAATSALPLSG